MDSTVQTEQIHLEKITYDNVQEVIGLSVSEAQKDFVATNSESLIEACLSLTDGKPSNARRISSGHSRAAGRTTA